MNSQTKIRVCSRCHSELGRRYERTGPVYDMKLWCVSCYRQEFPNEPVPITVAELISQLQALPEWARDLPVACSYDGGCGTNVYGVEGPTDGDEFGGGGVGLIGE
jgi:hypothetical protein